MRFITVAAVAGLLAMGAALAPASSPRSAAAAAANASAPVQAAAATTSPPKVVIIVGPVAGNTLQYEQDADAAAVEALKYTPNVVKIYTPNATWAVVRPALQGASIVVYMGHGNGFPSPYSTTLMPDRQDGLGLDPVAGNGDTNVQYWGEQYLSEDVQLAPNAVVLLGHLCYASGSSEPGNPDPTRAVAQQRVDNFAAGFIGAGAAAVIADAHSYAAANYIDEIFTAHESIGTAWLTANSNQGNEFSFASTRTPGMTVQMDPDSSGMYYRSIVGNMALATDSVIDGAPATPNPTPNPSPSPTAPVGGAPTPSPTPTPMPTPSPTPSASPSPTPKPTPTPSPSPSPTTPPVSVTIPTAQFTVPGAAAVTADGANLYPDASLGGTAAGATTAGAPVPVPIGTGVRLLANAGRGPNDSTVFAVRTLDGNVSGFMSSAVLSPRNSVGPAVTSLIAPSAFSPNGDGRQDSFAMTTGLSEPSSWMLTITAPNGSVDLSTAGSGSAVNVAWDGTNDGQHLPDGTYTWHLSATDAWGNPPLVKTGQLRIDTQAPKLISVATGSAGSVSTGSGASNASAVFSPNGDGQADTWVAPFELSEPGSIDATVTSSLGLIVRHLAVPTSAGSASLTWDGRSDRGGGVADGPYTVAVDGQDAAGNVSPTVNVQVIVYRALASVAAAPTIFYPQDKDSLAKSTRLSFTLLAPATVTWQIQNAVGVVVYTQYDAVAMPARSLSMTWAGLDQSNALVPAGAYVAVLTVTNGNLTAISRTPLTLAAFGITLGSTTVKRGGPITVTAVSAEPLSGAPRLTISQPGLASRTIAMVRSSDGTWRVTTKLSPAGHTGTLRLTVTGIDTHGGANTTTTTVLLR